MFDIVRVFRGVERYEVVDGERVTLFPAKLDRLQGKCWSCWSPDLALSMRTHEDVPALELRSNRPGARSANACSGPRAAASKKIRNYPSGPAECGLFQCLAGLNAGNSIATSTATMPMATITITNSIRVNAGGMRLMFCFIELTRTSQPHSAVESKANRIRNAYFTAKAAASRRTPRRFAFAVCKRCADRSWSARAPAPLFHWPCGVIHEPTTNPHVPPSRGE